VHTEVKERVAVVDLRASSADWLVVVAEMERLRTSGGVNVLVVALDGATEVPGVDSVSAAGLTRFELPVVAALEGEIGGTLAALALGCDIRVSDASLRLKLPPMDDRLCLLLGREFASLNGMAGPFSASGALARGLVSRVAADGESALQLAEKVARVIAARGPLATRLGKEALWRGLAMPLEQALRFETDLTLLLQTTKDRAEGVRAFLEKRAPTFEGE
jgi:enoyl-CoA hydratase/carnithine racemase